MLTFMTAHWDNVLWIDETKAEKFGYNTQHQKTKHSVSAQTPHASC